MKLEKENEIFGHQPGLFLLFFTEMWERFSYYGMRALLVLFLVSQVADGGWSWSRKDALSLYALYTGLVYLTPIFGGMIADKLLGYRNAVVLGAFLMTLGHASMAFDTPSTFYAGLVLLMIGNGFFKPNISSIVGQLYADHAEKKDGAYTIFYMGINSGAFLGILLCGYFGEKVGWAYGFGLAGIFMALGMVMFYLGQSLFGEIGKREKKALAGSAVGSQGTVVESSKVVNDRLIVIGILSFFTIFFWMAFEQAGGSMTIFAKDYTGRILSGSAATIFFWANTALTVVPLAVVTFVLVKLISKTYGHIPMSNIAIAISFVLIWAIALWMLNKEFKMKAYVVAFDAPVSTEAGGAETIKHFERTIQYDEPLYEGQKLFLIDREAKGGDGKLKVISEEQSQQFEGEFNATVIKEKQNETEIPASWFGILNSFFIISCAPILSRIWESRYNPSAPFKFGMGLVSLGLGFGVLAIGSMGIDNEAKAATVSIWWLIFAYLLHTLGELCVSPVGLSYVSKLAPMRLVGLMFGVWFCATAIANYLAGWSGSFIDPISEKYGLAFFFSIFTVIPVLSGVLIWLLTPKIKKMMHGIE